MKFGAVVCDGLDESVEQTAGKFRGFFAPFASAEAVAYNGAELHPLLRNVEFEGVAVVAHRLPSGVCHVLVLCADKAGVAHYFKSQSHSAIKS